MLLQRRAHSFCRSKLDKDSLKNLLHLIKNNPTLSGSSDQIDSIIPEIEFENEPVSLPYLKSLFYKRKNVYDADVRDFVDNNVRPFNDEVFKPKSILKHMSDEEKNRIHVQADIKLQEIEDSGLSRSELAGFEGRF